MVWTFSGLGCASVSQSGYNGARPDRTNQVEKYRHSIVQSAETYIGSGYRHGGCGPGFDCSGLVYRIYSELGYPIARNASRQFNQGVPRKMKHAQAGDLVFFRSRGRINHVAIITGARRGKLNVVHSTNSKGVIEEDVLKSGYWKNRICGVRDILSK